MAAGLVALAVSALLLSAPDTRNVRAAEPIQGCTELVVNGSFESPGVGWSIMPGSPQAQYSALRWWADDGGAYSMLAGNLSAVNVEGASSFEQSIQLPANGTLVLEFRYMGVIDGVPGVGDMQYVDLIDAVSSVPLARLLEIQNGDNAWQFSQYDLTPYGGREVKLVFGVGNNGEDGRIAMFVDAVSLLFCPTGEVPLETPTPIVATATPLTPAPGVTLYPSEYPTVAPPSPLQPTLWPTPWPTLWPTATPVVWPTPWPTLWPTPWPTPWPSPWPTRWPTPWPTVYPTIWPPFVTATPTGWPTTVPPQSCTDILVNGSFEQAGAWEFGQTPLAGTIVNSFGGVAGLGSRAAQLGNPPGFKADTQSYSSVRQLVTIPANAGAAQLRWWAVFGSQEGFAQSVGPNSDRQELILLNGDLSTLDVLFRIRRVDQAIQQMSTDLTRFVGRTFYIYFNAFNDGNGQPTWMQLDGLQLCISNQPIQPFGTSLGASSAAPLQAAAPVAYAQPTGVNNAPAVVDALGSLMVPRDGNNAPDGLVVATSTVQVQPAPAAPAPAVTPVPPAQPSPTPATQGESQGAEAPAQQLTAAEVVMSGAAENTGPGPLAIAVTLGVIMIAVGVLVAGIMQAVRPPRP